MKVGFRFSSGSRIRPYAFHAGQFAEETPAGAGAVEDLGRGRATR
jgi:hypothetical protein